MKPSGGRQLGIKLHHLHGTSTVEGFPSRLFWRCLWLSPPDTLRERHASYQSVRCCTDPIAPSA
ncbi:hypothetical protein [Brasilonema sennae]|uniref:hypothetical protein n=1 Tax=Brasilonema sennae TaxID=1397703 RepID=UPI0030DB5A34